MYMFVLFSVQTISVAGIARKLRTITQ